MFQNYYKIENIEQMPAFFINVAAASDVWLFLSSNGGLTAGRQNASFSIFPYETDDRLHLATSTGPKTLIRLEGGDIWEPFSKGYNTSYKITRNLYKRTTGDAVLFEEINHCLNLSFNYIWETSELYGLVRTAEIKNLGQEACKFEILDGVENIIPHGIPSNLAATSSTLTDAYKAAERIGNMAIYSLTATIGDTVEPVEVLRGNVAWYLGSAKTFLLSSRQILDFVNNKEVENEERTAGRKCAFFIYEKLLLEADANSSWVMVFDAKKRQRDIMQLIKTLAEESSDTLLKKVKEDIAQGTDELMLIVARADGLQLTNDKNGNTRHYMNVLYNNMRGGVFIDGYKFEPRLFSEYLKGANKDVYSRYKDFTADNILDLHTKARATNDADLIRLSMEFLPLTFSRRHGDPSRPWNWFNINVKDENQNRVYYYEGNWRDIFQNWEAMGLSFPGYIASMIMKFFNATTIDGHNPYRITSHGIDWETPAPHDPWGAIGYWGDHQIVYLNKLLEWLDAYKPEMIQDLVNRDIFVYANVPYEILPYENLLKDAKHTIHFNRELHDKIMKETAELGSDAKLLIKSKVSFAEKLIVPILAKLSSLVPGGGIWMNVQRPEWNDANNAIVGNGLSMVTVYQMYRHINFCTSLLDKLPSDTQISNEVADWFEEINDILINRANLTPRAFMDKAGQSFGSYRAKVYKSGFSGKKTIETSKIKSFFQEAVKTLGESIDKNKRPDGMYHAYNILHLLDNDLKITHLFLMLEGQTAVLGSGRLGAKEAVDLCLAMEKSDLLCPRLRQFYLYPIKNLKTFIDRNIIPTELANKSDLITQQLRANKTDLVFMDAGTNIRFSETICESKDLENRLKLLNASEKEANIIREIYETVFEHKQFTGRSGIMYKFEGIGSIYWHQNSKFMLSLQEILTKTAKEGNDISELKNIYYRLQDGFGFRKTPKEWGSFPLEPHSHSPKDMPAQQPGMTGMVKEDILTRMAELGITVENGCISFDTALLKESEFLTDESTFTYPDVNNEYQTIAIPKDALVFTICQVPVILKKGAKSHSLTKEQSEQIFNRTGEIKKIEII